MFRFKQFTIQQDRTAMKVCTDACVLGAYANVGTGGRILDIGTGTGLLALMAAQRNATAQIDAVEIDEAAAQQARENVLDSPFADRVNIWHDKIQEYSFTRRGGSYHRILTNPPFYTNHLQSPDAAVNRALHTGALPPKELIEAVRRLLKQDGQWWVLLPPYEAGQLALQAADAGLKPFKRLHLRHNARKPVFRVITAFSSEVNEVADETLDIYEIDGRTYSDAFRTLLQDFYLIF